MGWQKERPKKSGVYFVATRDGLRAGMKSITYMREGDEAPIYVESNIKENTVLVTLLLLIAIGVACLIFIPGEANKLDDAMNNCRHECVAIASEGFMYGPQIGCVCTGTLP